MTDVTVRWEVWIFDGSWRFNACFDAREKAEKEERWYKWVGYSRTEIRCRTTRYQRREHITTG